MAYSGMAWQTCKGVVSRSSTYETALSSQATCSLQCRGQGGPVEAAACRLEV